MRRSVASVACAAMLGAVSTIALAGGPNLLVNGDFETGTSAGWMNWAAGWSNPVFRQFNSAIAGRSGNYCLKLSTSNGSFGVYQEVNVTPGRYYRLECLWKATFTSMSGNWGEIEVLQGPFVLKTADERPDDLPHKLYSYDQPEPGAVPVTFDWVWTPELDSNNDVDFNDYNGIRQATGNKMTVVFKAGAIGGPNTQEWFDDVKFYEVRKQPADFDLDGDIDLNDFSYFQSCFNGPNRPPTNASCWDTDVDGDADVDLADFSFFQRCYNGANRPARCASAL